MRVTEKISLEEYDRLAPKRWPYRVPDISSKNLWDRLGDCIYEYKSKSPKQRLGVHGKINIKTDLAGKNVLISNHFYYFGSKAKPLPKRLNKLCHQTQGHKSYANANLLEPFIAWCSSYPQGQLGWPDFIVDWKYRPQCGCVSRKKDDEKDTIIERTS